MTALTALSGYLCLVLAWAAAVFAAAASWVGARRADARLAEAGRRALLAAAALSTLAVLALLWAFVRHDFSIAYVWQNSGTDTPALYLLAGIWGGQNGSLLFWSFLLSLWGAAVTWRSWRTEAALMPWFVAVLGAVLAFFLGVTAFVANPFELLSVLPLEGNGLNPLLQHPGMAFHPPALYLGFTGLAVPYAFGMAALLSGRTDVGWILASRRWTLFAWGFLTVGLALGAWWSYAVLGWGGYWGWDPVENAALMPWIAATGLVHSVMVQERRGMFVVWNMALVILTFGLVVVGTFLTRAGLVSSVHSFAQSDIGPSFLAFTAVLLLGSLALLWLKLGNLRSKRQLEDVLSRESAFLVNNLVFMGALFGVFWGTLFPLFSEIVTNQRVTAGAPYFNRVVLPVLWAALLLMGIAPVVAWGHNRGRVLLRSLWPSFAGSLAFAAALVLLGVRSPIALVAFWTSAFAGLVTASEILRAVRSRTAGGEPLALAVGRLFGRNRRRFGGYVVHLGVAALAVGIVGSNVFQSGTEGSVLPGGTLTAGDYTLTYRGLGTVVGANQSSVVARLDVQQGGSSVGLVQPRRDTYRLHQDQPVTVPSVLHRPLDDVYAVLGVIDPQSQQVTVKVVVNPLMAFIWLGLLVMVLGTAVAAWPDRRERRVMDVELRRLLDPAPGHA